MRSLAEDLEEELITRYGTLLSGAVLKELLGYATSAAYRQALLRGNVSIPVFSLPHRRGKFALAKDVAQWLAAQRDKSIVAAATPDAEANTTGMV
jgi:hypothetical protein